MSGAGFYTDAQCGDKQSLELSWLLTPQERDRVSLLEFVRGTLSSLSRKEDGRYEAVHVSRIRNSFRKLGAPAIYKIALRLSELLREVEPLFGGYWLLAPYRVVEIDGKFMFVGGLPDAHGMLGDVRREGLARFVSRGIAENFPAQSLESWMGVPPHDTSAIVAAFISNHTRTAAQTSNLAGVSFLSLVPSAARKGRPFEWIDKVVEAIPSERIAVCKQSNQGRTRFFSATIHRGNIVSEAPIHAGLGRLLFAISAQNGTPVKAALRSTAQATEITVGARLPVEEFRLALSISKDIVRGGQSSTFIVATDLAPALAMRLSALGCSLEIEQ